MDLARSIDAYLRHNATHVLGEAPSVHRPTVLAVEIAEFPALRIGHAVNTICGAQFGLVVYQTLELEHVPGMLWDDISHLAINDPLVEYVLCWIDYDGDGKNRFLLRMPSSGAIGYSQGNDATRQAWQFLLKLLTQLHGEGAQQLPEPRLPSV